MSADGGESLPPSELDFGAALRITCGDDTVVLSPERPEIRVGRAKGNDLVIHDPVISRRQCRFFWRDGQPWVADDGSACGTFLRGGLIREALLVPGDEVLVGHTKIAITAG